MFQNSPTFAFVYLQAIYLALLARSRANGSGDSVNSVSDNQVSYLLLLRILALFGIVALLSGFYLIEFE